MKETCRTCGGVGRMVNPNIAYMNHLTCQACNGRGLADYPTPQTGHVTRVITVRMTVNEHEFLKEEAHSRKLSMNILCRGLLTGTLDNGHEKKQAVDYPIRSYIDVTGETNGGTEVRQVPVANGSVPRRERLEGAGSTGS